MHLVLPYYITATFIGSVFLTLMLLLLVTRNRRLGQIILAWLLLTGLLAFRGFYLDTNGIPPKFLLAVAPPLLLIIFSFISSRGRQFMDTLSLRALTLISIVRIPVELVLYWLFLNGTVPELMTFAGRNFDVLAGITAPIIYYTCFQGEVITHKKLLLGWNIVCLGLLLNIVINAVLSAPFRFQQFGFDQPNKAILYFPFVWLPSFIVMVVLFSHLVSIRRLVMHSQERMKPIHQ